MKLSTKIKLLPIVLGILNLLIATGVVLLLVIPMINGTGMFEQSPKVFNGFFNNWLVLIIISIALFVVGNIAAAIFSFSKKSWLPSLITAILLLTMIILTLEDYLKMLFFFSGVIQAILSLVIRYLIKHGDEHDIFGYYDDIKDEDIDIKFPKIREP